MKKSVHVFYVKNNKTHTYVFYVKLEYFMNVTYKTHKYIFYMYYIFVKLVFCACSENVFICSDFFFFHTESPLD